VIHTELAAKLLIPVPGVVSVEIDPPGPELDGANPLFAQLPGNRLRGGIDPIRAVVEPAQRRPAEAFKRADTVIAKVGDEIRVEARNRRNRATTSIALRPDGHGCRADHVYDLGVELLQGTLQGAAARAAHAVVRVGRKPEVGDHKNPNLPRDLGRRAEG